MSTCSGTCTDMVDATFEHVPQTYPREITPSRSRNKYERTHTASLYYTKDYPFFFSGVEDPKSHVKAFRAQMITSGGSDTIRCKMLTTISPLSHSSVECLRSSSWPIKLTPRGCPTSLTSNKGKESCSKNT